MLGFVSYVLYLGFARLSHPLLLVLSVHHSFSQITRHWVTQDDFSWSFLRMACLF